MSKERFKDIDELEGKTIDKLRNLTQDLREFKQAGWPSNTNTINSISAELKTLRNELAMIRKAKEKIRKDAIAELEVPPN